MITITILALLCLDLCVGFNENFLKSKTYFSVAKHLSIKHDYEYKIDHNKRKNIVIDKKIVSIFCGIMLPFVSIVNPFFEQSVSAVDTVVVQTVQTQKTKTTPQNPQKQVEKSVAKPAKPEQKLAEEVALEIAINNKNNNVQRYDELLIEIKNFKTNIEALQKEVVKLETSVVQLSNKLRRNDIDQVKRSALIAEKDNEIKNINEVFFFFFF
jgi:hypothetical protein